MGLIVEVGGKEEGEGLLLGGVVVVTSVSIVNSNRLFICLV